MLDPAAWRVLIIDDEEDIRDVLSLLLRDSGYQVHTTADGNAGLTVCDALLPEIVITDIRMPGKNGIEVLEHIKKHHPGIEVIVATAFGEMALAIAALRLNASDFITKPIAAEALMVALDRAKERILTQRKLTEYTALLEKGLARTSQKLIESYTYQQKLHQDKMMSLGRLAASVAHEINNPLSGVLNYVRLMIRMTSKKALAAQELVKFTAYLTMVEKEVDRCSRIVGNLLTFARKSDPIHQPIDLRDLVERCLNLGGHRLKLNNIAAAVEFKDPLPAVNGDPNQLQQCLINLIFNAADAMPSGGRLDLKIVPSEDRRWIEIHVTDSGCGIAAEDLPHIFEPFFTTKNEGCGTGLGLSTTFGIIEGHHGSIDVNSRTGEGSTFTIKLPAESAGGTSGSS